jgi:hypothetical protein
VKLPWSDATAAACGIDALLRAIAPGCGFGRAALAGRRPFGPGDEVAAAAASARVAELARSAPAERIAALRDAIAGAPDPLPAAARAAAGETLGDADFHDLVRFIEALRSVAAAAERSGSVPGLGLPGVPAELDAALDPGRTAGGGFYLDDAFDPALAAARAHGAARQAAYDSARSRLTAHVATALGVPSVRDGEFIVARETLPAGAVPPGVRVLREAPTYLLCELALDADALAALAARDETAAEVARCEEAVRARLSTSVAACAGVLANACAALGDLDLLAARAVFAAREGGVVPEIGGRSIALAGARLPPLAERLEARGRPYEPVSLVLDGPAVVTGPNMGGKTAALRTLGFAAACAILGVPVPARAARLPLFAEVVWLGVAGDRASDEGDLLSAFGAEVVELRSVFARRATTGSQPMLVLLDEFARTTAPREGRALLVAVLAELRERGALGLAATHFAGVARAAGVAHFTTGRLKAPAAGVAGRSNGGAPAASLGAALAGIAAALDYALEPAGDGPEGGSGALGLAAALGLDPRVLARAEGVLRAEGA